MNKYIILITILVILLAGCTQETQSANPTWVDELIQKFQSDPVGNPPQSVYSYDFNGQTVYYVPPQCCDQFSMLYNSSGDVICAPDGGLDGKGDGRCPNFISERSKEKRIWQDLRTR